MGCVYRMKNSPFWWLKYIGLNGHPQYESSKSTEHAVAKSMLAEREGKLAGGVPVTSAVGRLTFKDAADDLLTDYETNKRKSEDELARRLRLHLLPYFGKLRMVEIDTTLVRKYIAKRQGDTIIVQHERTIRTRKGVIELPEKRKPVSNAEINRELQVLKRCFNLAIEENRLLHCPHIPMLKESKPRRGFLDPEQFKEVLAFLAPALQPLVRFAYITGWRIADEVQTLTWSHIDFADGTVRLHDSKNSEGRVFPMNADLRALLQAQRKLTDKLQRTKGSVIPWVFHREGEPIKSFYKAWKAACRAAGYPGRYPHDMRRSAARNMVRRGIHQTAIKQLAGWKTDSMFNRYHVLDQRDLQQAAELLDGVAGDLRVRSRKKPAMIGIVTRGPT